MVEQAQEFIDDLREVFREQDDQAIWTYAEIAKHLKLEVETVRKIAKNDSTFPKPCNFARARYHAGKVKAWAIKSNRA